MASTHVKQAAGGAFGHSGSPEAQYQVRGRNTGGSLHRRGANKAWEPAEASMAPKVVVVHKEKQEAALQARIAEAIGRIVAENTATRQAAADALLAIEYVPFVSAAETTRARLVAAGVIS